MKYKVFKQFPRDEERLFAQFSETNDARFFCEKKAEADGLMKINVTYKLYKGHELIEEFNAMTQTGQGTSAQGAGAKSGFTPTPFNTAPRPAGVPHRWSSNKDENEDKNE